MVKFYAYSRTDKDQVPKELRSQQASSGERAKPSLSQKETSKRNRHQSAQKKMKSMKISIVSRLDKLNLLPYSFSEDKMGSFFFDELQATNDSESSDFWKSFYRTIMPKSQTLPLVLLNHKEILKALLPIVKDNSTAFFGLKLLFALLRDIREEAFEWMLETGMSVVAEVMMQNERVYERSMAVLAAFAKSCFKLLNSKFNDFIRSAMKICFGSIVAKQILRAFAELIAFIYKKSATATAKKEIVELLAHVTFNMPIDHEKDPILGRNLVYFVSCFMAEAMKDTQAFLEPDFTIIIEQYVITLAKSVDVGNVKNNNLVTALRFFRIVNFKMMKAELKFDRKTTGSATAIKFSQALSFLENLRHLVLKEYLEDLILTLLADRLLFKEGIVFTDFYKQYAFGVLQQEFGTSTYRQLLTASLMPKLPGQLPEQLLQSVTSMNELLGCTEELLMGKLTEQTAESLAIDNCLLCSDKPVLTSHVSVDICRKILSKMNHLMHNVTEGSICEEIAKIGLLLSKIARENSFEDQLAKSVNLDVDKMAAVFQMTQELPLALGVLNIVGFSTESNQAKFLVESAKKLWQMLKESWSAISFLESKSDFSLSALNDQQIAFFYDPQTDNDLETHLTVYLSILSILGHSIEGDHHSTKSSPAAAKFVEFYQQHKIVSSWFIRSALRLSAFKNFVLRNCKDKLHLCLLSRDSLARQNVLHLIEEHAEFADLNTAFQNGTLTSVLNYVRSKA